jgi:broad specificity phosphatase PhoE
MENKITILNKSFYFVRHGQTDWNKKQDTLCHTPDIQLNSTGVKQVEDVRSGINALNISKIYSSPLMRAKQTAEIINEHLQVPIEFHEGLGKIQPATVAQTVNAVLKSSNELLLIVSHGEVYRVLVRILNADAVHVNAQNAGLYHFKVDSHGNWTIEAMKA